MAQTVTVACKMPSGVILNLDEYEKVPYGQVPALKTGARFTLKGNAVHRDPEKMERNPSLVGGYALTEIPADFWDAWIARNAESSLVKDGLIFAAAKTNDAQARAKEQSNVVAMFPPAPRQAAGVEPASRE